jgi:DNA-binding transcriptional MerR regulator
MSAPEAADLAGITYRQLDYWGRKGWVVPAQVERVSAGRRVRRYNEGDVLRLAALAHLGRSGLDVAAFGPLVGSLELTAGDSVVVVGPATELEVIAAGELRNHLRASGPGRYVVFDPAALRRSLVARHADSTPTTLDERRSA